MTKRANRERIAAMEQVQKQFAPRSKAGPAEILETLKKLKLSKFTLGELLELLPHYGVEIKKGGRGTAKTR